MAITVIARSFHQLPSSLRRGWVLVGFGGAMTLLAIAGAYWLIPASKTQGASQTIVAQPTSQPGKIEASPTAVLPDYVRQLTALLLEPESSDRNQALQNALRSWASADPTAAAAWLRSQATLNYSEILTELFSSSGITTRDAVALADHLVQADAATARESGYALIFGLNRRGDFIASAGYATAAPEGMRRDLVIAAYHDWGRREPEQALLSATHVADATVRQFALQSVLSGWARSHPEELAEAALTFPEGAEKSAALTKALRAWMIKDPWQAGDWILTHQVAMPVAENFFARDER